MENEHMICGPLNSGKHTKRVRHGLGDEGIHSPTGTVHAVNPGQASA